MRVKLLFCCFCCLLLSGLRAQSDSTRDYILNYKDSKAEIINKGRQLLLTKMIQNDNFKVTEVTNYLLAQEDENYLAFLPLEKWLLYYWTGQYEKVLADLPEEKALRKLYRSVKIQPASDDLLAKLYQTVTEHRQEINWRIGTVNMNETDKDFLRLNLDYLLDGGASRYFYRNDSLQRRTIAFLNSHPSSPYETYIRRNLLREVVYADWGLAVECFSGYGAFTNQLPTHFKNTVPIGIAFDVAYKNFVLYLRDFIGFSRTKDTLVFPEGIWKKGMQARVYLPEASVGYAVMDNHRLKLAPFVGIASTSISPTEHDQNKNLVNDGVELKFTTAYVAGLNLDFKFGHPDAFAFNTKTRQSYWFLRVRYAYSWAQFDKKYTGFSGNLHYLTIGVGGFGRTVKRTH